MLSAESVELQSPRP